MPSLKVAHVREQGVNLIIVPLESRFGSKPTADQHAAIAEIQVAARSAGLAGTVVPVWLSGGRMSFIAPSQWHSYFGRLHWNQIQASINRTLSW